MESLKAPDSDTVEYWQKQAKLYEQKAKELQHELDEYTENSAQLEKELEASLVQEEKQNKELKHQNQRLKNEIESLKNKLDRSQRENNALENELRVLKKDKDNQAVYIRELEQKNDDLERGQRVISESVACIQTLLNQEYERNAVLESEVDEIENLRVKLQRATDEARDSNDSILDNLSNTSINESRVSSELTEEQLHAAQMLEDLITPDDLGLPSTSNISNDLKQELKVLEKIPIHKKEAGTGEPVTNGHVTNSSNTKPETESQAPISSPPRREINGNMMTPSSRVTAINIVGDLLRKVGLERFLCRDCGMVKCSCLESATADNRSTNAGETKKENIVDNTEDVQFRNVKITRQFSDSDNGDLLNKKAPLTQRLSEQPFQRATQGDNGKLRRSFAVRSRENLENLFKSIRKK